MQVNRTIAPPILLAENFDIPRAKELIMNNGSKLLIINSGDVDVCRLDIICDAGSKYQQKKLQAMGSLSLMTEGTNNFTSKQISEHFDFWGSFVNTGANKDFARVTASSLTKFLPQTLQMLEEVVKYPSFPDNELKIWAMKGKQTLRIEMDKTSTLARMEFFKQIFGEKHPYGMFALPNDYDLVSNNDIKEFHSSQLGSNNSTVFLSGKVSDKEIDLVKNHFGEDVWGNTSNNLHPETDKGKSNPGQYFAEKPNAVQSAIHVGRQLFPRNHPDYPEMMIVNTILGGYFGSRLMKNIREDKGYTYGINSYVGSLRHAGFFIIFTEVGAKHTNNTLKEIRKELQRLREEPVTEEELEHVRRYIIGDMLRSFNGPFAIADNIISLHNFNSMDYSFYQRIIEAVKNITPQRIMELAKKWLNNDSLVECVSGSKNPF
ncbi:MAG: M16 family metallopeptidase [Bacteroidales bacterium]